MFDIQKSVGFFDPEKVSGKVNVIGCGAVGSAIAELLSRLGLKVIDIWDDDVVCNHNVNNQIYTTLDVGDKKTTALTSLLYRINPDIIINKHEKCTTSEKVSGYVFLAIDNIDTRRELCESWRKNPDIKFVTDGRMALTEAVSYSADWFNWTEQGNLLKSMQFTHEEAQQATPVTACGLAQSVICTPRVLAALMVTNWMKFIKSNGTNYNRFIQVDCYQHFLEAFSAL